jgi:drug/metabolite transporter (DMT)-like permease
MIVFFEVPIAAIISFIFKIGKEPTLSIIPGVILILTGCILVVLRTKPDIAEGERKLAS